MKNKLIVKVRNMIYEFDHFTTKSIDIISNETIIEADSVEIKENIIKLKDYDLSAIHPKSLVKINDSGI